ncbi:DUF1552 domain-containing protein [Bremerella sp. JC770]|uniref:DUF1552 domain-containing protein n=1 Tax=Bremerella sp. JC770 TaxID=3232137 RepID=UPI003457444C
MTNRRRFLLGAGVGLTLPLLEYFQAKSLGGENNGTPPQRMLLISNNLGVLPGPFFPTGTGADYKLSPYLNELADLRGDFTVFSGLSHPACLGGHSTENCFLTAAKHPTKSGFRNTISLDQYASQRLGRQTRFETLNLGVNIDRANRSLAWTRDGALIPAEDSPANLFRKLFLHGSPKEIESQLHRLRLQGSILDTIHQSTRQMTLRMGKSDRYRLDQYFTSIRELEERIHRSGEWASKPKPEAPEVPPSDITERHLLFEKCEQMLAIALLALQSDSTRIVTLMIDAFATPVFHLGDEEKSSTGYHNLSHHGRDPASIAQLEQADRRQMKMLASLLAKLKDTSAEANSLLDSTMVLYGSNMGDANIHSNTNLPILLAGGGFRHGHHIAFDHDNNTPLSNLFVSMIQRMDIESDEFGSSTGTLTGLDLTPSG